MNERMKGLIMRIILDQPILEKIANDYKINTTIYQSISLLQLIEDFCKENNMTRNVFFEKSSIDFMKDYEKPKREAA